MARWFPGEELFHADFVLVPVCSAAHWSLIVATHPRSVHSATRRRIDRQRREAAGAEPPNSGAAAGRDEAGADAAIDESDISSESEAEVVETDPREQERGMLLHFDSLGLHNTTKLCQRFNRFLQVLWRERCLPKEDAGEDEDKLEFLDVHKPTVRRHSTAAFISRCHPTGCPLPSDPRCPPLQVRRQSNGSDCGAHVAHFARQLLETPPRPSMRDGVDSLKKQYGQLAAGRKLDVRGTLMSIVDKYVQDQGSALAEETKMSEGEGGEGSDTDAVEIVDAPAETAEDGRRGTPADDPCSPPAGEVGGREDGENGDTGSGGGGARVSPPPEIAHAQQEDESTQVGEDAEAGVGEAPTGDGLPAAGEASGGAGKGEAILSDSDTEKPHIFRQRPPAAQAGEGESEHPAQEAAVDARNGTSEGSSAPWSSVHALGRALNRAGVTGATGAHTCLASTVSPRTTRKRASSEAAVHSPSARRDGAGAAAAQLVGMYPSLVVGDDDVLLVSEAPPRARRRTSASRTGGGAADADTS